MVETPWDIGARLVCRGNEIDGTYTLAGAVRRFQDMPEQERLLAEIHPDFPVGGHSILDPKLIVGLGDPPAC